MMEQGHIFEHFQVKSAPYGGKCCGCTRHFERDDRIVQTKIADPFTYTKATFVWICVDCAHKLGELLMAVTDA